LERIGKFFTVFGVLAFSLMVIGLFSLFLKNRSEIPISGDKIGVVKVYGIIRSSDKYLEFLDKLERNKTVKAVVLRVDSPGGIVGACQEIHDKVKELAKKKPVVVSMGSVAASGGLYISVPATKIVANPGTITGSIGVIIQTYNVSELIKKLGIKVVTVKSGKYKDLLNPFEKPNPEKIKVVQSLINNSYEQFVRAVAEGRRLPIEKVKEFADGRVFTGEQAQKLGLVDDLGNFERAVEIAKKLGNCPNAKLYFVKPKRSFFKRLFGEETEELIGNLLRITNGNIEGTELMYLFN